ncbi:hypothetical protein Mgra_00001235 [Meloidogyne graminicola]|uniref:Uncharacterized protein n=1 Tax=Meloidogyne graminicola TaxID=189291 RepID=A0A8T0A1K1_9BILA|nr:hypothetical protein Mgra_00001235 [Meloidogyne graminicola]
MEPVSRIVDAVVRNNKAKYLVQNASGEPPFYISSAVMRQHSVMGIKFYENVLITGRMILEDN